MEKLKRINKKEKLLFSLEIGLLLLISLFHLSGNGLLSLLISFSLATIMAIPSLDTCFHMVLIAMPFFNTFNSAVGNISMFYLMAGIYIFKELIIKRHINKKKIVCLILLLISRAFCDDFMVWTKCSIMLSFFILSYKENYFKDNILYYLSWYNFSSLASLLIGYIMLKAGSSIYTGSYIYGVSGSTIRFAGLVGDSVMCAQLICVMLSTSLLCIYLSGWKSIKYYLYSCIYVFFLLVTYSRSGLLIAFFVIFIFVLFTICKNAKSKSTIVRSFLLIFVVTVLIIGTSIYIINNYQDNIIIRNFVIRFSELDLTNGRDQITLLYLDKIFYRWQTIFVSVPHEYYVSGITLTSGYHITNSHNIYIETIIMFGLLPSIFIFLWLFKIVAQEVKKDDGIVRLLPVISLLLTGIVVHGYLYFSMYYIAIISFICIKFATEQRYIEVKDGKSNYYTYS